MLSKIIQFVKRHQYNIFLAICIILIGFTSYNLGKINSGEKGEIKITEGANIYKAIEESKTSSQAEGTPKITPKPLDLRVVVSKNSDKYHYSWCSTWKRIKPENQVWFNSEEEAKGAGYTLAGNCTR